MIEVRFEPCGHLGSDVEEARRILGEYWDGRFCAACQLAEAQPPMPEPDEPEDGSAGWCICHDATVCPFEAMAAAEETDAGGEAW